MPNIRYLRKRERKTMKWTPEAMRQAMQEVEAGRLSLRQAARQFQVPKSSLSDRVSGRVSSHCSGGQRQLLTPEEENSLVEYCLYSASHGFPATKPQVLVHALAIYNHRHPDAPKTMLGQTWWVNFMERHHHRLTAQTAGIIDSGRASCAKRGPIEDYFRLLAATLKEHGLREKPRQIYSCDETGFQLDSARARVIVPQGTKLAYRQAQGTRDHITVLACLNAAGEDVPPFIIYKGGYPGGTDNKEGVPNTLYGKSPAGYMDSELFRNWFVGHFLKFAVKDRPLLLVMAGLQSHLDPELVQAAQKEGVVLLCLPPHTSHILQPLDVSFFRPLKADFSGFTADLSAMSHSFLVSKKEFSRVLRDSYQRVKDQRVVVAGFRRCGLYPLDPMAIDWSGVMPSRQRRGTSSATSCAKPDVTHPPQVSSPPIQSPPAPCNSKSSSLMAQKMSEHTEEVEAQALARGARKQERTEDTSPAATSSTLSGDSHPSRRKRAAPRAAAGSDPSTPTAPSGTPSTPANLPAQGHHPPSPAPQVNDRAARKRGREPAMWRCGRCRKPDPPDSSDGSLSRVQCDNCHKWFHTICVDWEQLDDGDDEFWCYWCLDV